MCVTQPPVHKHGHQVVMQHVKYTKKRFITIIRLIWVISEKRTEYCMPLNNVHLKNDDAVIAVKTSECGDSGGSGTGNGDDVNTAAIGAVTAVAAVAVVCVVAGAMIYMKKRKQSKYVPHDKHSNTESFEQNETF